MKKFIIACCALFLAVAALLYAYYYEGVYVGPAHDADDAQTFVKQEGKTILLDQGEGFQPFEIRGVDVGCGYPGYFATDYAIDKDTYLRWFRQIKDMGANTVRVYILQNSAFYEAFYEFNKDNPDPLYLIHGVWITDYAQNSHMDAFASDYLAQFKDDIRTMIDVIHGNRFVELGRLSGTGSYTRDVSDWVIGYILGVEWEAPTVAYTNIEQEERAAYAGEYLGTTADASAFEAALAEAGNEAFRYETQRYGEQRLVAFSNWPTTDPFEYPEDVAELFHKYTQVDVNHIVFGDAVQSGTFASYHIYPYYPDYLRYPEVAESLTQQDAAAGASDGTATDASASDGAAGQATEGAADASTADGGLDAAAAALALDDENTYRAYLTLINEHHADIPVIISEFGVPSARGMTYIDANTGRNQGYTSEDEQGRAIARCYQDIMEAGCSGSIIFAWQDEWFKRTWNTLETVDLLHTPNWSDYQTNEQYFGLLSFDPGEERSVCYVDGDDEEWADADVVGEADGRTLSMKYDEKYLYFMVRGDDVGPDTVLYLPIDTTQKSGATACDDPGVSFDRAADFLMVIDGEDGSRVLVQERYEVFRPSMWLATEQRDPYVDPPASDSSVFKPIYLATRLATGIDLVMTDGEAAALLGSDIDPEDAYFYEVCDTGRLTYGDANPSHDSFDSLADFCFGDGFVEIKIPWQLLNFSNPSEMQIHDDYYEHYGIENMTIDRMYVGVGDGGETIELFEERLEPWGEKVETHERLKESYYIVQQMWAYDVDPETLWNTGQDDDDAPVVETVVHVRESASDGQGSVGSSYDGGADTL